MSTSISGESAFLHQPGFAPAALKEIKTLSPTHMRIFLGTPAMTNQNSWDFTDLNAALAGVAGVGDPELALGPAPGWMTDGTSTTPGRLMTAHFGDYASYVANLISYINNGQLLNGSIKAQPMLKPIKWLSIYNEPDLNGLWTAPHHADYVDLYNLVAAAVWNVDPTVKIVAGEISYFDFGFFTDFINGLSQTQISSLGAFAFHNYPIGCTSANVTENPTDDVIFGRTATLAGSIPGIYSALGSLPLWITESNVTYVYNNNGLNSCDNTPYTPDPRAGKPFFASWRPYLFSQLAKQEAQHLTPESPLQMVHHWNYFADVQFAEVDDTSGNPYIAYWVDCFLGQYFHDSTTPATILKTDALPNIEQLAVQYPDGTVAAMVVNLTVDSTGRNGAPTAMTLDLSQLGRFGSISVLNVDGCTNPSTAPISRDVQVAEVPISFPTLTPGCAGTNGYGVAFVLATPSPSISNVEGSGLSVPPVQTISANGFLTLFGSNFAPAGTSRSVSQSDIINGRLPTSLANTCVNAGGGQAFPTYVSPTQINAIAPTPTLLAPGLTTTVSVSANCGEANQITSSPFNVAYSGASPEFLYWAVNSSGQNPVVAVAANGDYIGPAGSVQGLTLRGARVGESITVYGIGFGKTISGGPVPGAITTKADPVASTASVTIGGITVAPSYVGVSGDAAGLYQVNLVVPVSAPAGNLPILLNVNGASTPSSGFIAVGQ